MALGVVEVQSEVGVLRRFFINGKGWFVNDAFGDEGNV